MFYIEKISLQNFKNYEVFTSNFKSGVNCIVGKNGIGKTNLLDSIYYLAFTKSAFNSIDNQLINNEFDHFYVNGYFKNNDAIDFISSGLIKGKKKEFLRNKKPIGKISSFIGTYPIVLITPYDTDLIRESSDSRRKFFDGLISQMNIDYLEILLKYKNLIKNRNALLKDNLKHGNLDLALLNVITDQIIPLAQKINQSRSEILNDFKLEFSKVYKELTSDSEEIEIEFDVTSKKDEIQLGFEKSFEKDKILGRTNFGPHKDDFIFLMNELSINKFGSQGQQKSFIIALKIVQFNLIEKAKGIKPILMLDDFFDRIDNERIDNFSKMLRENKFGQVFITDSHPERVEKVLGEFPINFIDIT